MTALLAASRVAPRAAPSPRTAVYEGIKDRGSCAPAACRKAATAENRNVARVASARDTCVLGRSDVPSAADVVVPVPDAVANRLRGTAHAIGRPAAKLKAAYIRSVQRPPTALRSA